MLMDCAFSEINSVCVCGVDCRMESIFRFLLHELGLVQDDFPDPKLHASIDYHKRELATTLETAKWQVVISFSVNSFYS